LKGSLSAFFFLLELPRVNSRQPLVFSCGTETLIFFISMRNGYFIRLTVCQLAFYLSGFFCHFAAIESFSSILNQSLFFFFARFVTSLGWANSRVGAAVGNAQRLRIYMPRIRFADKKGGGGRGSVDER